MKMDKWYLLKDVIEIGGEEIKKNGGEGEFKYDIVDIL
jgi:hypothetical protein